MKINHTHRIFIGILFTMLLTNTANAQIEVEFNEEERHHLSIITGGSALTGESESAFTLGLDYEYRINRLIGIGIVAEQAFGELDATTLLAVADIHVWRGFAFQVGPGVEFVDNESNFVARFGALYEFEFGEGYTISPQVHYDFSTEDTIVFGLAFGAAF